jgi:hypothetical protein
MLECKTGRCYIGPDRAQTRAALRGVLADLPEPEFARLMDDPDRCVQVMAPACNAFLQVATHQIIVTGAGIGEKVEVHTEWIFLSPLLERLSVIETRSYVAQALTAALARLAGHTDLEVLEIAGWTGPVGPAGGVPRPN